MVDVEEFRILPLEACTATRALLPGTGRRGGRIAEGRRETTPHTPRCTGPAGGKR